MKKIRTNKMEKLNKFEKARLLSARALELAQGDKPKVKVSKGVKISKDYVKIAREEYEKGKLDLEVYKKEK